MRVRHTIALVLSILTVPVLALGIIDPMEGGMAMLAAGILILVTWLVGRVPVPRLEWIAWVSTVAVGAVALGAAMVLWDAGITGPGGQGLPWWLVVLLVAYELGVVVTFAGGIWNVVRHIATLRTLREHRAELPAS
jgi:hypothetical protein